MTLLNPLSKNRFSSTSLTEVDYIGNAKLINTFKNKTTGINDLINNVFFINSINQMPRNIESANLVINAKELESYRRDIDKIKSIYNDAFKEMTEKGERTSPPLNNLRRNIEGLFNGRASDFNPDKAFHYLQCYEQVDRVIKKLRENKELLENDWRFDDVSNYPDWRYTHTWGRATPTDEEIPFVYFDPYWNKIQESACQCKHKDSCATCQP